MPIFVFIVVALGAFILGAIIGALKAANFATCDRYHIEDVEQAFEVPLNYDAPEPGCNAA